MHAAPDRPGNEFVRRLRLVAVAALLMATPGAAEAVIHDVPGTYATIQDAINVAADGDSIRVAAGSYATNAVFGAVRLVIYSDAGSAATTLTGGGGRIFDVPNAGNANSVIRGFTITGGSGQGAGILTTVPLEIEDVRFTGNTASNNFGAGIRATGGASADTLRITNCRFDANSAKYGAGISVETAHPLLVEGCSFENNSVAGSAFAAGAGIYFGASSTTATIRDSDFTGNTARDGAAIAISSASSVAATIENCNFDDNTSGTADFGGALYLVPWVVTTVQGCTFTNNFAGNGGAVYSASDLRMYDCVLAGNEALQVAAVYLDTAFGTPRIQRCTITQNRGTDAVSTLGAVHINNASATPDLSQTIVWDNCSNSTTNELTGIAGSSVTGACVDIDLGGVGVVDVSALTDNVNADPAFCVPDVACGNYVLGDYTLDSASPCAPANNACGLLIGALGGACVPPPVPVHEVPGDFPTIQAAIDAAASGDSIRVAPGTYTENLHFGTKQLNLFSDGHPGLTVIDGDGAGLVIDLPDAGSEGSWIRGFTILNGLTFSNGGGIRTNSPIALEDLNFVDCVTSIEDGGGLHAGGISSTNPLTVTNCNFTNCEAEDGGGISWDGTGTYPMIVTGCTFTGNRARNDALSKGGAIHYRGDQDLTIVDCHFQDNESTADGGAVANEGGTQSVTILDCVFEDNHTDLPAQNGDDAGALFLGQGPAVIRGSSFTGNIAGGAGAISAIYTDLEMTNCLVAGNVANAAGGMILYTEFAADTVRIENCTITANASIDNRPGGIFVYFDSPGPWPLSLTQTIIWDNCAPDSTEVGAVAAGTSVVGTCMNVDMSGVSLLDFSAVTDNVNADPLFTSPEACGVFAAGDYTLGATSPCLAQNSPCGYEIGAYGTPIPDATGVNEALAGGGVLPGSGLSVDAPAPNPFGPSVTLRFSIGTSQPVTATVYDVFGRAVRSLRTPSFAAAGTYTTTWDGTGVTGRRVASGIYFVRLTAGDRSVTRKVTMLR